MAKPKKETREWVNLTVKSKMTSYVSWKQFLCVLSILVLVIGHLYDKYEQVSKLVTKIETLILK